MSFVAIKTRESIDIIRWRHFKDGMSPEEIAEHEGLRVDTVWSSISRGHAREQMSRMFQLMEMKQRGQLENERFRRRLRKALFLRHEKAIEHLLSGKRTLLYNSTGEIHNQEIIDPNFIPFTRD